MIGMSRQTARLIAGAERLAQAIDDILTTPKGSRVMRRDYGSDLPYLIDAPMNDETIVDIYAATAEAIDLWEPEFELRRVEIVGASAGRMELRLTGDDAVLNVEVAA